MNSDLSTSTNKRKRVASDDLTETESNDADEIDEIDGESSNFDRYVGAARQVYSFKCMDDLIEMYQQNCKQNDVKQEIECVPRSYEEEYLREAIGSERNCVNDDQCQGLKISNCSGFVLREYKLPSEEPMASGSHRSMCLMCRRYEVARLYYRYQALGKAPPEKTCISSFYNLVNVDGEYDMRDCIVSQNGYSGLALPVVLHSKSGYTQHCVGGVKFFKQSRLRCPGTQTNMHGPFLTRRAGLRTQAAGSAHPTST
ncbi:MAG: hypothetical protein CMM07_22600 [Rhodopirellula sp.]|nr:hypothetical protein [Rhodopirellula sp.]